MNESDRRRLVVNIGCGPLEGGKLPPYFGGWEALRVDVDPDVRPDILADLTDLSQIADRSADAVWASHCVEHLHQHQVHIALREIHRVLRDDGFACVIVPDLQSVANHVADDRMHLALYDSAAGPVTPHDMIFGFGAAIAGGRHSMAHRCGFTPGMLQQHFRGVPFAEVLLRRRVPQFELMAVARVTAARDEAERNALISALDL